MKFEDIIKEYSSLSTAVSEKLFDLTYSNLSEEQLKAELNLLSKVIFGRVLNIQKQVNSEKTVTIR